MTSEAHEYHQNWEGCQQLFANDREVSNGLIYLWQFAT